MPTAPCVFLVDDDEDDVFLLQRVFAQHSPICLLEPLADGEHLLKALSQARMLPRLILLDLNMPVMGGLEALRLIRRQPRYDAISIVILTTSDQDADQHRAAEWGANGFLTKPSTLEGLNQMVLRLRMNWLEGRCTGVGTTGV